MGRCACSHVEYFRREVCELVDQPLTVDLIQDATRVVVPIAHNSAVIIPLMRVTFPIVCIPSLPLLVRPKTIVFGRTSVLLQMFFLLQREISEMRGATGVKFCTMVSTRPYFIMPVENFGEGAPQKNFRGQKHAKFGSISDDFEVWRRISWKRMKIFKIGFLFCLPQFLLR